MSDVTNNQRNSHDDSDAAVEPYGIDPSQTTARSKIEPLARPSKDSMPTTQARAGKSVGSLTNKLDNLITPKSPRRVNDALSRAQLPISYLEDKYDEYYEVTEENRQILNSMPWLTLAFIVANDKGGTGKTVVQTALAEYAQMVAYGRTVTFGDTNTNQSSVQEQLSITIDPNLLSFEHMSRDLYRMIDALNSDEPNMPKPDFPLTNYRRFMEITHRTHNGLTVIPNSETYSHHVGLGIACAVVEQAISLSYATFFDGGNKFLNPFEEAAFRNSPYRYFVCRATDSKSITGLVKTMRDFSNRGYTECVKHALICVSEGTDDRKREMYHRMCQFADAAEMNSFGLTAENYEQKIFTIPFSNALSGRNVAEIPMFSLNPSNGPGFGHNDMFIEIDVALAIAKFFRGLLQSEPPTDGEMEKDFQSAQESIRAQIEERSGNVDRELNFPNAEEITQRYLIMQKDAEKADNQPSVTE